MAKKNNKNRQYTAKPSIIDDSVVESIQENTSVETETVEEPTPEVEEVVEDIVRFGDWDVESYSLEDCGEVDE
jgi:hypothetical protein